MAPQKSTSVKVSHGCRLHMTPLIRWTPTSIRHVLHPPRLGARRTGGTTQSVAVLTWVDLELEATLGSTTLKVVWRWGVAGGLQLLFDAGYD